MTALKVGALLRAAKESHPRSFTRWVETELPFGADTARRMMAISRAYESLPAEVLAGLPKPWQALYAIRHLPQEQLALGVSQGSLRPDTTVVEAKQFAATGSTVIVRHHPAEVAAGALMAHDPSDLDPLVLSALRVWLVRPLAVDELGADPVAAAAEE